MIPFFAVVCTIFLLSILSLIVVCWGTGSRYKGGAPIISLAILVLLVSLNIWMVSASLCSFKQVTVIADKYDDHVYFVEIDGRDLQVIPKDPEKPLVKIRIKYPASLGIDYTCLPDYNYLKQVD